MAYINVAEWSPDQVTDWLKGKRRRPQSIQLATVCVYVCMCVIQCVCVCVCGPRPIRRQAGPARRRLIGIDDDALCARL